MTSTLAVPFVADIAKGTQDAAKLAGWNARLIDGKGNVTEWSRIMGEAIAQKADAIISIAASHGKANVLILGDNEFPGEVTRVKGMQDEFKKLCPGCKTTFHGTLVGKLGTDLGPLTQTLLRRDPSITWVLS